MFLKPGLRVELLEVGLERLGVGLRPTWATVDDDAGQRRRRPTTGSDGERDVLGRRSMNSVADGPDWSTTCAAPAVSSSRWMPSASCAATIARAGGAERDQAGEQHDGAVEVVDLRDLALLARLFLLLGCCLLGLVGFGHRRSPDPQRVEGGADVGLQLVADAAGDEGQRGADQQQADDHLGREADLRRR